MQRYDLIGRPFKECKTIVTMCELDVQMAIEGLMTISMYNISVIFQGEMIADGECFAPSPAGSG